MNRREFITLFGAGWAAWPMEAWTQGERVRVVGVLMPLAAADANGQARMAAFQQELQRLGWAEGRNLRIEARWSAGNPDAMRKYAAGLVTLAPDVILAPALRSRPVGSS
jgi:putative tryptophan/tyrosine transport system substrate-binding protein